MLPAQHVLASNSKQYFYYSACVAYAPTQVPIACAYSWSSQDVPGRALVGLQDACPTSNPELTIPVYALATFGGFCYTPLSHHSVMCALWPWGMVCTLYPICNPQSS
jgi:hypothetical protein